KLQLLKDLSAVYRAKICQWLSRQLSAISRQARSTHSSVSDCISESQELYLLAGHGLRQNWGVPYRESKVLLISRCKIKIVGQNRQRGAPLKTLIAQSPQR